jgi:hypothetical protein
LTPDTAIMKASLLTQIAPENRLLNRLGTETRASRSAFIAVSFIQRAGMKHLFKGLKPLLDVFVRPTAWLPLAQTSTRLAERTRPSAPRHPADRLRVRATRDRPHASVLAVVLADGRVVRVPALRCRDLTAVAGHRATAIAQVRPGGEARHRCCSRFRKSRKISLQAGTTL